MVADLNNSSSDAVHTSPSSEAVLERAPLDDVMIAMDIVDTLRNDAYVVERELSENERKSKLIERLREIYRSQGIEVPERILEEGVAALEQDRFVYQPLSDSLETKLAKLYVTRLNWGRYVLGGLGCLLALLIGWYALFEAPRQRATAARQLELTQTIPKQIEQLRSQIAAEGKDGELPAVADIVRQGLAAAKSGDLANSRAARDKLENYFNLLRATYEVRIVSRRGEVSGLWRVPKVNRQSRNYYLVVEAVAADGTVLPQSIVNEETGKRETVRKWAVRVPEAVLQRVRADKQADGIIDNPIVAVKERGRLKPDWRITRAGGEITQW